jgi:hypothetical protein
MQGPPSDDPQPGPSGARFHSFDPLDVPADLLQAIGLLVLEANELESTARMGLSMFLDLGAREGQIAFQKLSAAAALETLADLAGDYLDPPRPVSSLASAARAGKAAYELRNRRAHSPVFLHGLTGQSTTHSQKVKIGKDSVNIDVTPEHVLAEAATIRDARFALFRCLEDLKRLQRQPKA